MMKTLVSRWMIVPAVVAGVLCLPALVQAADHDHGGGRHRAPIRYAEHSRYGGRFDHSGAFRYDHAGPWFHGPMHYEWDYVRRFRPGFRTIVIGPSTYYYYPALPVGYQTVVVNGQTYYLAGGVYYVSYPYAGATAYLVVAPPV